MADLPSNIQKINDLEVSADAPLSESLMSKIGSNINALIDISSSFRVAEFTSSGTWTAPPGVTKVILIGCGGGGGGASGGSGIGGAGGAGAPLGISVVSVTPGQSYNVTIGGGGSAGVGGPGGNGGSTTFGSYAFLGGGGGRTYNINSPSTTADYRGIPPAGGAYGGGPAFGAYFSAQSSFGYAGGSGEGWGGGAGPFGPGGNGGSPGTPGQSAPPNSGAGGGGGLGLNSPGGAGGSGRLIVVWLGLPTS